MENNLATCSIIGCGIIGSSLIKRFATIKKFISFYNRTSERAEQLYDPSCSQILYHLEEAFLTDTVIIAIPDIADILNYLAVTKTVQVKTVVLTANIEEPYIEKLKSILEVKGITFIYCAILCSNRDIEEGKARFAFVGKKDSMGVFDNIVI